MYTVIEQWTPRSEFLDASPEEREALFGAVGAELPRLEAAGVTCLGWSATEPVPNGTAHGWVAVWQMTDSAAVTQFFEAVEAAGWYEYFDQDNTLGELVPVPQVLEQLMRLRP
jgi:hypothetical protein